MEAKVNSMKDFKVLQGARREEITLMGSEKFKAEVKASKEQKQAKLGVFVQKMIPNLQLKEKCTEEAERLLEIDKHLNKVPSA